MRRRSKTSIRTQHLFSHIRVPTTKLFRLWVATTTRLSNRTPLLSVRYQPVEAMKPARRVVVTVETVITAEEPVSQEAWVVVVSLLETDEQEDV